MSEIPKEAVEAVIERNKRRATRLMDLPPDLMNQVAGAVVYPEGIMILSADALMILNAFVESGHMVQEPHPRTIREARDALRKWIDGDDLRWATDEGMAEAEAELEGT